MAKKKKKKLLKQLSNWVLQLGTYPSKNRRRVGIGLLALSLLTFVLFLFNFAWIVVTDSRYGVDLSEAARKVHQTEVTVQAKRGTIYDRTGTPIAIDSTTYTVYAIIDKDYVSALNEALYVKEDQFDKVAEIFHDKLGMETSYVKGQLSLPNLKQVYFGPEGKNISYSTMQEIQAAMDNAKIRGIAFNTSPGRMYPNGNFASFFIGLAQLEDNKDGSQSLRGQTGMERSMNDILAGQDGKIIYEKDSLGRILPGTESVKTKVIDGQDVYTSLSTVLQRSLETNMTVFFDEKTKGEFATATVVSAKTGEILATTQRPSFDADTKEGVTKDLVWRSLLYQDAIEPGSTMKVMTLASAIDNGSFNPNAYYTNNGYTIADRTINDWKINAGYPPETLTYAQGFALSSNVAMLHLEQAMGDEKWLNYLSKFRFGYPTRFGMSDEEGGLFPADNVVSIAMSSFGQGVSATPIQMLRAFSAIGNDGVMLEPKFISAIYDPNTDSARLSHTEVVGNPVSKTAAQQTRQYMVTVGTLPYYGTLYSSSAGGAVIQVDGYNIAVKSGTAEIPKEDGTGYKDGYNELINSVVAMIPAEDPEFIMYVTVQKPEHWSLLYWQDIVNPVLKEAMLLKDSLNLTEPISELASITKETEYALPDVIGHTPGETAADLRKHLVQPVILGNGSKITKTSVKIGSNVTSNQQILLLTDSLNEMPDMYGWTKENADKFSEWTGIEVTYVGAGSTVVQQSLATASSLKDTKKITLTLGD